MKRIIYRERRFLDQYSCVDTERKTTLDRVWEEGGLIYGYTDRYNIKCIAKEDIISMEDVN